MRATAAIFILLGAASMAAGAGPASAPSATMPQNIDKALDENISELSCKKLALHSAVDFLRLQTKSNIAVNWTALGLTGITPDTPVTAWLCNVTLEEALRAILEQLPTTHSRANFLIGGNAVEITTTYELGKQAVIRLYDVSRILQASLSGPATEAQMAAHGAFLQQLVHEELQGAGEDVDAKGRGIVVKEGHMVVTESRRGQLFAEHVLSLFESPVRLGRYAEGTQESVREKEARGRMAELLGHGAGAAGPVTLAEILADPRKVVGPVSVIALPGTEAAAKDKGGLDYTVNSAGIVIIGPAAEIRGRVMLAVYDLRDVLKRMALKSTQNPPASAAELAATVLAAVKAKVPAGDEKGAEWTDFGKAPPSMALYEYLLVVSASPAQQRAVTAALVDLHRKQVGVFAEVLRHGEVGTIAGVAEG